MGALECLLILPERKQAEEALRDSEEKFRTIFEMSLSMICIADIQTKMFLKINPAFIAVLGYQEKNCCNIQMFDFIHPMIELSPMK
jgi:PAS domain S-box-containing protein